jgi:hypothetical protein
VEAAPLPPPGSPVRSLEVEVEVEAEAMLEMRVAQPQPQQDPQGHHKLLTVCQ